MIGIIPADLFVLLCSHMDVKLLVKVSELNKRVRLLVLQILMQRLKLDRPHNLPAQELGKFLNVTVTNLRLYFSEIGDVDKSKLPSLAQIPNFSSLLGTRSLPTISWTYIVTLNSLEFLTYILDFRSSTNNAAETLKEAYRAACKSKRVGIAFVILSRLKTMKYDPMDLLQETYRMGHTSSNPNCLTQQFEDHLGPEAVQKIYAQRHGTLLCCVSESGDPNTIEHFFQKLGTPEKSDFTLPGHLPAAFRVGKGNQVLEIMLKAGFRDQILEGAYTVMNIPFIEKCRKKLDLEKHPHDKELSYACATGNASIVKYALTRIDPAHCNKQAASEKICASGRLDLVELFIEKQLFWLNEISYPIYLNNLFLHAQEQNQLPHLFRLIDKIQDNAAIVASQAYVQAAQKSHNATHEQEQTHSRARNDLLRAINQHDLERIKTFPPGILNGKIINALKNSDTTTGLDIFVDLVKRGFKLSADMPNFDVTDLFCIILREGHLNAAKALIDAISSLETERASDLMKAAADKYLEEAVSGRKPEMARHIYDLIINAKLPEVEPQQPQVDPPPPPLPQTGWEKFKAFLSSLLPRLWNYLSGFFR